MSRSWRRRLVVFALTATIVGVIGVAPALATWTPGAPSDPGGVTPTVVGSGTCSSVGSVGTQFKISKLYVDKSYAIDGGPTISIDAAPDKKSFSWTISPGFQVHDVTVLGVFTPFNHYDYGETPRDQDGSLHAPLIGTSSTFLAFGYFCWSAVEVEPGTFSISGNKFEDTDADGLPDEPSVGLGGWTIELKQGETVLQSTETGDSGAYSFSDLVAGEYQVCEVLKEGWAQTSPGGCHSVTVGPEVEDAFGINFLNVQGVDLCDHPASASGGGTSATFELVNPCEPGEVKVVDVSVEEDVEGEEDIVILRPLTATEPLAIAGTLTFVRDLANPIPPLLYSQDLEGDITNEVPVCNGEGEPPGEDTWCVTGVDVSSSEGSMTVTWSIFGRDDPRFK